MPATLLVGQNARNKLVLAEFRARARGARAPLSLALHERTRIWLARDACLFAKR